MNEGQTNHLSNVIPDAKYIECFSMVQNNEVHLKRQAFPKSSIIARGEGFDRRGSIR